MVADQRAAYHVPGDAGLVGRVVLAHIMVPLLPAVIVWCVTVLLGAVQGVGDFGNSMRFLFSFVFLSVWLTIPVSFLCVYPLHALCRRLDRCVWPVFVLGGVVIGAFGAPLVGQFIYGGSFVLPTSSFLQSDIGGLFAVCGAVTLYGFWAMIYASHRVRRLTFTWPLKSLIILALGSSVLAL